MLNASEFLDTASGVGFNISLLAEVAQVVEHGTENAGVDSSSLSLGTITLSPVGFVANSPVLRLANARFADILLTSILTIHPA